MRAHTHTPTLRTGFVAHQGEGPPLSFTNMCLVIWQAFERPGHAPALGTAFLEEPVVQSY